MIRSIKRWAPVIAAGGGPRGRFFKTWWRKWEKHFSSNPAEILIAIGPSICKEQYVVSEDLALSFLEDYPDVGENSSSPIQGFQRIKFQLDLWDLNRRIALDSGIKEEHNFHQWLLHHGEPGTVFFSPLQSGKKRTAGSFYLLKGLDST